MLARHPVTGKPIRILNCEATLWRDASTLVWLDAALLTVTNTWARYTVGVSSIEDYRAVYSTGIKPEVCILLGDPEAATSWIRAGEWRNVSLAVAPRTVLQSVRECLPTITNMLCLEELHELYGYVGAPWDTTVEDARVLVAAALQYCRTGPVNASRRIQGLQVLDQVLPPPPLILLTQYYRPEKAARRKEIDACLAKNLVNPLVDRLVLLNETVDISLPSNPKLTVKSIGRRLHFSDVIRWIYEEAPAGSIVVFANSDIYLDNTWRNLWSVNMQNVFLSLLRWDDGPEGEAPRLFGPRADSQDTWAVAADSIKERTWSWPALEIPFGKGGCDNAINVEMLRQKFLVANPALTFVTHHVHMSGYRTYNPHDIVDRPVYMHVHPTGLHDLKPEKTMPPVCMTISESAHSLEPVGSATQSQLRTFKTMAAKVHKDLLSGGTTGAFELPIYELADCFVNNEGLVRTYSSILIGSSAAAKEGWSKARMNKLAPAGKVEHVLVAPLPEAVLQDAATFTHRYLGKILALYSVKQADFYAEDRPESVAALRMFRWAANGSVPVIRRDPNASVYAQTATIWHPQDGVAAWTTSVEVMALRTNLRVGWEKQPSRKGSIVCRVDGSWVTNDLVAQLEREFPDDDVDVITPTTPFVDAVETLLGARAFVFKSSESAWNLLWALPLRAKVIDLQFEMSPSLEGIHMAKVCGLSHHLIIKARDTVPSSQDVSDYTKKVIGVLALTPSTPPAQVPTLFMPAADTKGFFAHSGDSFRELARLWEARGHVHIVYQDGLSNIWLGAVGSGGTLLYDRPTVEWLNRSAPHEREWSRALFGNPDAKGQNAVPWTFWPRRPELVEDMVTGGLHEAGYANRGRRIVFYGRSENAVQAERRAADWGSVFGSNDEFVHVKGLNPYPYSQREYLERIANARFGLCLAGYGKKCHREIECMALGCVPVVAPEVDMESYAVPPVEGTHYLRCRVPGDLDTLLSSVDEGAWAKMSAAGHAWWLANASVEGSWNLTKRLAGLL